jgi:hypothetical protein
LVLDDSYVHFTSRGDILTFEVEPDNPYDPSAIRLYFNGKQIGSVQRDKAKILSKEIQAGRTFRAAAEEVKPPILNDPYPHITMEIVG